MERYRNPSTTPDSSCYQRFEFETAYDAMLVHNAATTSHRVSVTLPSKIHPELKDVEVAHVRTPVVDGLIERHLNGNTIIFEFEDCEPETQARRVAALESWVVEFTNALNQRRAESTRRLGLWMKPGRVRAPKKAA